MFKHIPAFTIDFSNEELQHLLLCINRPAIVQKVLKCLWSRLAQPTNTWPVASPRLDLNHPDYHLTWICPEAKSPNDSTHKPIKSLSWNDAYCGDRGSWFPSECSVECSCGIIARLESPRDTLLQKYEEDRQSIDGEFSLRLKPYRVGFHFWPIQKHDTHIDWLVCPGTESVDDPHHTPHTFFSFEDGYNSLTCICGKIRSLDELKPMCAY